MSQEKVEIVRRAVDALNRRDLPTLDSLWSEDGEFHSRLAASEGRVFRGREGIRDYFAWLDDAFEEFRSEVEEIIDPGEDRVVALLRFNARGKASGVPLDQSFGARQARVGREGSRQTIKLNTQQVGRAGEQFVAAE